jgi:hypothetical protein
MKHESDAATDHVARNLRKTRRPTSQRWPIYHRRRRQRGPNVGKTLSVDAISEQMKAHNRDLNSLLGASGSSLLSTAVPAIFRQLLAFAKQTNARDPMGGGMHQA